MPSNDPSNGNGNGAAHVHHTARITIVMDLCAHTVVLDAKVPNLDCALSMLAQATRALESQLRQQQALEFAARQQRAAQDEQVRRMLSTGKG
jgi:hypothetical protein